LVEDDCRLFFYEDCFCLLTDVVVLMRDQEGVVATKEVVPSRAVVRTPFELLCSSPGDGLSLFLEGIDDEYSESLQASWRDAVIDSIVDLPVVVFDPRWSLEDFGYGEDQWDTECVLEQLACTVKEWREFYLLEADVVVLHVCADGGSALDWLRVEERLGEYHRQESVLMYCDSGFPSRDNVVAFCREHNVPLVTSLDDLVPLVYQRLAFLLQDSPLLSHRQEDSAESPPREG
jgi:hypothetical protein